MPPKELMDLLNCHHEQSMRTEGVYDANVFNAYPLLGCYYLTCSNTSDIVGMLAASGDEDWMSKVEKSKKYIDPLLASAREQIQKSRLQVVGIPCGLVKAA